MNHAELVDGETNGAIVRARVDRDVAFGSKDNREAGVVGGSNRGESSKDGLAGEDGEAINGNDEGTNVFALHISNVGRRGTGNDGREVAALANVASSDFQTQSRMRATNELRHGIQTMKGVVGDSEVQRGQ